MRRLLIVAVGIAAMFGCATSTTTSSGRCELDLELSPARGRPGEEITASGGPFTANPYDQLVRVGGVTATVIDARRDDCDTCDTCREDAGCTACGRCTACTSVCDTCTSTVTFLVPDLPAGPTTVRIVDGFGTSEPAPFTVRRRSDDTAIVP